MKIFTTLFCSLLLLPMIVSAKEPGISWEKYFQPAGDSPVWNFHFRRMDNSLFLMYNVGNAFTLNNPGFIEAGLDGEARFEYQMDDNQNFLLIDIEKHGGIYYLYNDSLDHDLSKLALIKLDSGSLNYDLIYDDSVPEAVEQFNISKYRDSLFYSYFDRVDYQSFFRIYNYNLNYIRTVVVDSATFSDYMLPGHSPMNTIMTSDGNFATYMMGSKTLNRVNPDTTYSVLCKINNDGKILWKQPLKNSDTVSTIFHKIFELKNGDFLLSGYNYKNYKEFNDYHLSLVKVSKDGILQDYKMFKTNSQSETADVVPLWNEQVYAIYGSEVSDTDENLTTFWLKFLDTDFNTLDEYYWHSDTVAQLVGITEKDDHSVIVYGQINNNKLYLAELHPDFLSVNDTELKGNKAISPNPASDFINVESYINAKYQIYNLLGTIIAQGNVDNSQLNVSAIPDGLYNIIFRTGGNSVSLRFIKQ